MTRGLMQLDRDSSGPVRDRRETALRMERGFLTSAAEGYQSQEAAADFERCLRLGGTLRDDELFATLIALGNYYQVRADLRRAAQVIESLKAGPRGAAVGPPEDRRLVWDDGVFARRFECRHFRPRGGNRGRGRSRPAQGRRRVVAGQRADSSGCLHLALVALLSRPSHRSPGGACTVGTLAEGIGFPKGLYMRAYIRSMETWLRVEAAQLDRAALVAADMISEGERHGFDVWRVAGATWQAAVGGLAALGDDDLDPSDLGTHIATVTAFLDNLRTIGVNIYTTVFDAVLGRLLIAAGRPEAARERLDTGLALAQDTGMCFYDAELLRVRAQTRDHLAARQADINAALELARHQGDLIPIARCAG